MACARPNGSSTGWETTPGCTANAPCHASSTRPAVHEVRRAVASPKPLTVTKVTAIEPAEVSGGVVTCLPSVDRGSHSESRPRTSELGEFPDQMPQVTGEM